MSLRERESAREPRRLVNDGIYRTAFQQAACALIVADSDLAIRAVNSRGVELLSLDEDALCGRPLLDFVQDGHEDVFSAMCRFVLERAGPELSIDRRWGVSDCHSRWLRSRIGALKAGDSDFLAIRLEALPAPVTQMASSLCSLDGLLRSHDVEGEVELSELKRQLESESIKLQALFEDSPAAMALYCGPGHTIERCNPSFAALFPGRRLVGRRSEDALPEFTRLGWSAVLDDVLLSGRAYVQKEVPVEIYEGGPLVYFDHSIFRIADARGRPYGVYQYSLDVTARVEAERALKKARDQAEAQSRTKSDFLAQMSHEIRTPLAAILGYVELLQSEELAPPERQRFLETVLRNGRTLTHIIDDILDLSKVEAGCMRIEAKPFDLRQLLSEVADLFQDKLTRKGPSLEIQIQPELPAQILADAHRLRQILVNIVGNAIKFSEKGSVIVRVFYEGPDLQIEVQDQGPGIEDAEVTHLFQPFGQAHQAAAPGGTGLGLVLSRKLARAMDGDLRLLRHQPGEGCLFLIEILAPTVDRQNLVIPERTADAPFLPQLDGLRVLLVDDAEDNRFLVENLLSGHGVRVDTARDGEEGLEKALHQTFDLILLDLQMPRMSGYEMLAALRREGRQLPVVALTAHVLEDEGQRLDSAGFSARLSKPVQFQEIFQTMQSVIARSRNERVNLNRNPMTARGLFH